ncbi:hypothetical protein XENOCAPTIV_012040 [Xenoophorus captivus]|uniref:Uncharacterized protein n=1 Tax=Xenoophorus captivus TaxID=1517983 RepID=A0ABV0SHX7_9TELE
MGFLRQMGKKHPQMVDHAQEASHVIDIFRLLHGFYSTHFIWVSTDSGRINNLSQELYSGFPKLTFVLQSYFRLLQSNQHLPQSFIVLLLQCPPDEDIVHLTKNSIQALQNACHALLKVLWCR